MKNNQKKKFDIKYFYPIMLCFLILFIGIGYASINSVTGEVSGNLNATAQDGVFISDVKYKNNIDGLINESHINSYVQTTLNSKIVLSKSNINSNISYTITIFNNSIYDYLFNEAVYGTEWYDNNDIVFTLSGIDNKTIIKSKQSLSFDITFKYKDGINITNNILNSYINFKFLRFYRISYLNFLESDITTNNYPLYAFANETLNINFTKDVSNIKVSMNKIDLVEGTDYTYKNRLLNILKVTGDLIIEKVSLITPVANADGSFITVDKIPGNGTIDEDKWVGDNYNVSFGINGSNSGQAKNYKYTLKIKNNTNEVWKMVKTIDTITNAGTAAKGKALRIFNSQVSAKKINPGEVLIITYTIKYRVSNNCTSSAYTVLSFNSGGQKQQVNLNFNFNMK